MANGLTSSLVARVYLGLGSNIDAESNLRIGLSELRRAYGSVDVSRVYRSAAVGFEGDDFLNLVVGVDTTESPVDIHARMERIHDLVGRERGSERYASRPLDIDLLLYDDIVLEHPRFRIPRRDVLEYSFVLGPLAELDPALVHPETGRSIAEHWRAFDQRCHPLHLVDVIL